MAFVRKRQMYEALPLWIQRSVRLVPFSWLAGSAYRRVLRRGSWFDNATREELRAYQEQALKRMLLFVVDQVPAYRGLRRVVEHYPAWEVLREFPLMEKETLQSDLARFLPRDFEKIPHYEVTTGGTSGNQLQIFLEDTSQAVEHAFVHRLWARVGYTPRHRKATFRGVSFRKLPPGVYWQYNPINNELQFSPFAMSERTLPAYIEKLIDYGAPYIHAYPSALDYLARYVLREELTDRLPVVRAAFLVSEGCTREQRDTIERAFRTRVFSFYGHSERAIMAGECEKNETYHSFPDYGICEILREDGTLCREGERGEIVGTGLLSRAMPLVRYRTGDYAVLEPPACECGRVWDRFSRVEGRWKQEMIVGKTGARISLTALNMHGPVFEKVRRYQYVQEKRGECILRVVVAPDFGEEDRRRIEEAYAAKTGEELTLRVAVVDNIPLTERGKLQRLVSKLSQYDESGG